jgi:hypothetical protein
VTRPVDVMEMLRQANPVPPGAADDGPFPTVTDLRAAWRSLPAEPATDVWDPGSPDRPRRWPKYAAAAALAAGVAALFLVPPDPEQPVEPVATVATGPEDPVELVTTTTIATESPFVGVWVSTDSDGSFQVMEILPTDGTDIEMLVIDDYATVCLYTPSTTTGTGQLQAIDTLIFPQPVLTCDDGTTPEIEGSSVAQELANLTFVRDPESDELVDSFGVTWLRATFDSSGSPLPPEGSPAAARTIVNGLIEAINAIAADESLDETSLPDVFTPDATINAFEVWGDQPVSDTGVLETWIDHLQAWGFEASVLDCVPEDGQLICKVRARWQTVSAEADETWIVTMGGERIQTLSVFSNGERFGDPLLPLSLAELDGWETWLRDTDPDTADRLLAPAGTAVGQPLVPRYDPALADEIAASIQQYVEQRPPGDEITVTSELVDFGDRLVGSIGAVARADGRTYVLAGRYETEADRFSTPQRAVLAAFDDAGVELWRTEIDGSPHDIEAIAGDLWVLRGDTTLLRIDSSNGEVLEDVNIGDAFDMTGAFGSLWIGSYDPTDGAVQLAHVSPDLSTTTIELPDGEAGDFTPSGPTAGAGAMWVPLGAGGVARIDPETMGMAVITADEIGHDVISLAFDEDVAYVASSSQVTSIVDGEVRATASTGEVWYLGSVGDTFGVLGPDGRFVALTADDPMLGEVRQVSTAGQSGSVGEIDGEAWVETGENYDLRRVGLVSSSDGDTS